jgi:hypothetical protein
MAHTSFNSCNKEKALDVSSDINNIAKCRVTSLVQPNGIYGSNNRS